MDKEERKDGKEKKKKKKAKVPIRRSKKATCVVFPELDERFLLQVKNFPLSDWLEHISVRKRAGYRKFAL